MRRRWRQKGYIREAEFKEGLHLNSKGCRSTCCRLRLGVALALCCVVQVSAIANPPVAASQPGYAAGAKASVFTLCSAATRLTSVDVSIMDNRAVVTSTCVSDTSGQYKISEKSGVIDFLVGRAEVRSVFAAEVADLFDAALTKSGAGQVVQIKWRSGQDCVTVSARSRMSRPLPQLFVAVSGDWRASIDYMVDQACRVVAIRLGNRLAILPTATPSSFELYGVQFSTT